MPLSVRQNKRRSSNHLFFQGLDWAFYEVLKAASEKAKRAVSDVFPGKVQLHFRSEADPFVAPEERRPGIFADILEDLATAFETIDPVNQTEIRKGFHECIGVPNEPDKGVIPYQLTICGLLIVQLILGPYVKRMRFLICAVSYPKRQRERITWLWHKIKSKFNIPFL